MFTYFSFSKFSSVGKFLFGVAWVLELGIRGGRQPRFIEPRENHAVTPLKILFLFSSSKEVGFSGDRWLVGGREMAAGACLSGRSGGARRQLRRRFPVGARAGHDGLGGREGSTGGGRSRRRLVVVAVFLRRAASRVHEEVGDRRHLESELVGNHRLHLLVGPPRLAEDRQQSSTLDVGEDQPRLLR